MGKEQTKGKKEFETVDVFQSEIKKFFMQCENEKSKKNISIYVMRPKFIVSVITLLKDVAIKTLELKKMLEIKGESQQFSKEFLEFQKQFLAGCENFGIKFEKALTEIDKTVNSLQKVKTELIESNNTLNNLNERLKSFESQK